MSLDATDMQATMNELKANFQLSGLSTEEASADLGISPKEFKSLMALRIDALEDVWILKDYLTEQVINNGEEPVEFSALTGDYHDYWYLNSRTIDDRLISVVC
ncbi:DUF2316 family protein [Lentilactobacillus kribbianus]|uniref:DUF2316 family protein n=1 Tax=Lentilactobacillus kribbianus TaxID=2729622 RepID=UPI00155253FA|nr:DUF2316 family protein [Lentilactobacillus kribbianus]